MAGTDPESEKRRRSPRYPRIDLGTATELARVIHEAVGTDAIPVKEMLQRWGYAERSGPGRVVLATLKRFGLLVRADRFHELGLDRRREWQKARLSELALEIFAEADTERV